MTIATLPQCSRTAQDITTQTNIKSPQLASKCTANPSSHARWNALPGNVLVAPNFEAFRGAVTTQSQIYTVTRTLYILLLAPSHPARAACVLALNPDLTYGRCQLTK